MIDICNEVHVFNEMEMRDFHDQVISYPERLENLRKFGFLFMNRIPSIVPHLESVAGFGDTLREEESRGGERGWGISVDILILETLNYSVECLLFDLQLSLTIVNVNDESAFRGQV
ncbi:hypothetical protein OCU04_012735 [Sclerotinia nivalis]|uniref:Uncharacterized protein n=1 Tax=Sclerotinia nivalis TaxID=352851 RepID=A0A9X0A9M4_9HELO|nr:hypothetical protein OCU04_012735 [Sclerotinia nivalis]